MWTFLTALRAPFFNEQNKSIGVASGAHCALRRNTISSSSQSTFQLKKPRLSKIAPHGRECTYNLLARPCIYTCLQAVHNFFTVEKFSSLIAKGESGGAPARSLIKGPQLKGTNALATLLICTSLSLKHAQKYGAGAHRRRAPEQKATVTKYTRTRVRARAGKTHTHSDKA